MISVGLLGLVTKLYRASESNMLFDGGSLVLYMCGIVVYVANIVKGLRIVTEGSYGQNLVDPKKSAHSAAAGEPVLGREDNLKVLSASNTILALVLVGVLVLQAGQWYAERADEREKVSILEKEETGTKKKERESQRERERSEPDDSASNAVGRKLSQKDGKKMR
jgi:ER membrane protein SH3